MTEMRCNMTYLLMWCPCFQHHLTHDTDARTGTSTGTKSHIIPLKIISKWQMQWHQLWYHHHVIGIMLLPCPCQKLTYPSKTTYKPHISVHVQISESYVSIYASYGPNAIHNVTRTTGIPTFHSIGICPWRNMPPTSNMASFMAP